MAFFLLLFSPLPHADVVVAALLSQRRSNLLFTHKYRAEGKQQQQEEFLLSDSCQSKQLHAVASQSRIKYSYIQAEPCLYEQRFNLLKP
ncbi:hypothetical protein JOB18_025037 [Solea senegalensis]|uniref:Secreted protein n=1 Tax=Solea senegalensis TaxID=28829 RepID=A0AAV6SHH4_SOLSE|nr:hypothetical protein JOB18_025037 [Solea senegalensis]